MVILRAKKNIDSPLERGKYFLDANELYSFFEEYIDWCLENPLKEVYSYGAKGEQGTFDRMRPPTLLGFCRYMKMTSYRLKFIVEKEGWQDHLTFFEESLLTISYEAAAAGLLKEAIVSRKLGLHDKIEISKTERRIVILKSPDNQRAIEQGWEDPLE